MCPLALYGLGFRAIFGLNQKPGNGIALMLLFSCFCVHIMSVCLCLCPCRLDVFVYSCLWFRFQCLVFRVEDLDGTF